MSPRVRTLLLIALGGVLLYPAWQLAHALPPFGAPTAPYGPMVNALGPPLRHVANMVSAVNFDFRAVDTLGEEFMLICAVTGTVMLLRGARGEGTRERALHLPGRAIEARPDATRLGARFFAPLLLVFGLYMAVHVTATPGGGFQGGVVLASGLLLMYAGEGYRTWRNVLSSRLLDVIEGGGALLFLGSGLWSMGQGRAFLENTLPLGQLGDLLSGGLMLVENAGVTCAVTAGFALLFIEFMEETRASGGED